MECAVTVVVINLVGQEGPFRRNGLTGLANFLELESALPVENYLNVLAHFLTIEPMRQVLIDLLTVSVAAIYPSASLPRAFWSAAGGTRNVIRSVWFVRKIHGSRCGAGDGRAVTSQIL